MRDILSELVNFQVSIFLHNSQDTLNMESDFDSYGKVTILMAYHLQGIYLLTILACILVNKNKEKEAVDLLQRGLAYLSNQSFPEISPINSSLGLQANQQDDIVMWDYWVEDVLFLLIFLGSYLFAS